VTTPLRRPALAVLSALLGAGLALGCAQGGHDAPTARTLRLPLRSEEPGTLDPARYGTLAEGQAISLVYETLLRFDPRARPYRLEPELLAALPVSADGGRTWRCELREGARFQDDPCFPGGRGRAVTAADVLYSFGRLVEDGDADNAWVVQGTIEGFEPDADGRRTRSGLRALDERAFEIRLTAPHRDFLYRLTMPCLAVVPREAVERYGSGFARHPVGTGPYRLEEDGWRAGRSLSFRRDPAGGAVAERLELLVFGDDRPMWLEFLAGGLDFVAVPDPLRAQVLPGGVLDAELAAEGVTVRTVPLLQLLFHGFDMQDPVLGGYAPERTALRRAIALALDPDELNDAFFDGAFVRFDGMIPPGLAGHPPGGRVEGAPRGPDLPRARALLAAAGYPGGEGLPPIRHYASSAWPGPEIGELLARQLGAIGVRLETRVLPFVELREAIGRRQAPFFTYGYGCDYPDAENALALFYGPNASPGVNVFNYEDVGFDRLYEELRTTAAPEARERLCERLRDTVLEDVPFVGSLAGSRTYLARPWLRNFEPDEALLDWMRWLDLDPGGRP